MSRVSEVVLSLAREHPLASLELVCAILSNGGGQRFDTQNLWFAFVNHFILINSIIESKHSALLKPISFMVQCSCISDQTQCCQFLARARTCSWLEVHVILYVEGQNLAELSGFQAPTCTCTALLLLAPRGIESVIVSEPSHIFVTFQIK